jgi:large conductance mechanosensitive channel
MGAVVLKGFKDFLMRGNVIELAVAVVIATAFTMIITAFTEHIVNPLVAVVGGANINGLGFQLIGSNPKTVVDIGAVITAAINFVLIAAVVYFVIVVPYQKIQERRKRGEEPGPAEPTEVELLAEIRDLLARTQHQR